MTLTGIGFFIENSKTIKDTLIAGSSDFARLPLSFLDDPYRIMLTFIIPIAYVGFLPMLVLKDNINLLAYILAGIILTIINYFLFKIVWHFGIKRYSSAG